MSVLALDLALVRDILLPGLSLTPGRGMMARVVAADTGAGGRLAIAGYLLDAELPRELSAGQNLRLVVRELTPEHVLLAAAPTAPPLPPEAAVLAAPIPLPGGGQLQVLEDGRGQDERGGERGGGHALGLRLDLPGLGALELRFGLDRTSVQASVAADPGPALAHAQAQAGELREALTRACGRPATVTVGARRRPLDVYA
ncbi:MAG TPA: hypothetical protein VFN65_12520 [Solirubrobacteraceae bacterium]|nr:hypothetical protein [Solirubrobacteraceae bacterium]